MRKYRITGIVLLTSLLLTGCAGSDKKQEQQLTKQDQQLTNQDQQPAKQEQTPAISEAAPTSEASQPNDVTQTPEQNGNSEDLLQQDWVKIQKDNIIDEKPQYSIAEEISIPMGNVIYLFYKAPDADVSDYMNYYGDLWVIGKDLCELVSQELYILPDTCGVITLNGREYLRVDQSYVTSSQTILSWVDEENTVRRLSFPGYLNSMEENELVVTVSLYDVVYSKKDKLSYGHTWKPYYYYMEDDDLKEYAAETMTKEEFLQYEGSSALLDGLRKQYEEKESELSFEFLKRENGLIHVMINSESENLIGYHYATYRINGNQLDLISEGEGTYSQLE